MGEEVGDAGLEGLWTDLVVISVDSVAALSLTYWWL